MELAGFALKRGSRTSHLLRDSLRFEHHALTRNRRLHGRAGGLRPPDLAACGERLRGDSSLRRLALDPPPRLREDSLSSVDP